jgi:glycosyltransferase involved in cell wall biosynthesis
MLISIVIRTLNEAKYLKELLNAIKSQKKEKYEVETIIIDSGSTDGTLSIAEEYGCRITFITKDNFTFGRSLNMGSEFANGDILVYISGHCIPANDSWLLNLIKPIENGSAGYTYGRQIGRDTTKFSEERIFEKYFPLKSKLPQKDFFCNNANSAIRRNIWRNFLFNETITGLEDMELAKRYYEDGGSIAYIADASVFHIHNETWTQIRRRYERESIALQKIMPEVNIKFTDMIRYIWISIYSDAKIAASKKCFFQEILGIVKFRLAQYTGSYRGNHEQREISKKQKENYFYPTKKI